MKKPSVLSEVIGKKFAEELVGSLEALLIRAHNLESTGRKLNFGADDNITKATVAAVRVLECCEFLVRDGNPLKITYFKSFSLTEEGKKKAKQLSDAFKKRIELGKKKTKIRVLLK